MLIPNKEDQELARACLANLLDLAEKHDIYEMTLPEWIMFLGFPNTDADTRPSDVVYKN